MRELRVNRVTVDLTPSEYQRLCELSRRGSMSRPEVFRTLLYQSESANQPTDTSEGSSDEQQ